MTDLNGLKLRAVVARLVEKMQDRDGWCGETHIQKTAYFLRDLVGVPLDYEFIIYKHGPYSFDLHDDLMAMKASRFLKTEARRPYGPSFRKGDLSEVITDRFPKTLGQFDRHIDFIAEELSSKGVKELERLGTALFVTNERPDVQDVGERARLVIRRKPHISLNQALVAVRTIDGLCKKAENRSLR
ncbi:MAG: hypothetical protein OXD31_03245 [Chloroflexi bacterium]|nr:hypothetical protein [Chloroflexota bacterium]